MKKRRIAKNDLEKHPRLLWNSYVNILATENYEDLSERQKPAWLVFQYESEVQNGGHLQYFENRGTIFLDETFAALGLLDALGQQAVFRDACDLFLSRERSRIETVEEFCLEANKGEFLSLDSRFYECSPQLTAYLELHLQKNRTEFIEVEE